MTETAIEKKGRGWRKRLHAGDEVTWNDPDDGSCSRIGVLSRIEFLGEGAAAITMTDGWRAEVFLKELS